MKTQPYYGFLGGEYVSDKQMPMDNNCFDEEEYSKCPKCGAFNKYELDRNVDEIEDETCENCGFDYQVQITWTMNVDTIDAEDK